MKRIVVFYILLILCTLCAACGFTQSPFNRYFELKMVDYIVLEEQDTHGGFHGDGSCHLILDCSQNADKARAIVENWSALPLPENLQLVMYGGEKDGVNYGFYFAQSAHWPTIENGVYKFVDRHSEAKDRSDASGLLDRYSFNFSIAVYDLDSDILYYFEMDT